MAVNTRTAARETRTVLLFIGRLQRDSSVVHWGPKPKMKADLSMAELLALVEIVDEHVDRNFPGVDPPRLLREIQQKLDTIIVRHRREFDITAKPGKKIKSAHKP